MKLSLLFAELTDSPQLNIIDNQEIFNKDRRQLMAFYDVDNAMTVKLDYDLPPYPTFREGIRRAPRREAHLSQADKALAIRNALRYIHPDHHLQMAREFARELEEHGRIYGYRFRPEGALHGKPIDQYRGNCIEAKAFQVMIDNNLDFDVALYPYELVTYGETGQMLYSYKLTFTLPTDAGILEYLRGKTFQVQQVAFAEKYFPGFQIP
jgi:hypothetical protein